MWTLRLDTTGSYPSNENSPVGMGVAITPALNEAIVEEICLCVGEGLEGG